MRIVVDDGLADVLGDGEIRWLTGQIEVVAVLLGLDGWRLDLTSADLPPSDPALATISPEPEYRHATMAVHVDQWLNAPGGRQQEVVRHELFHLVLAGVVDVAEDLLEDAGGGPFRTRRLRVEVEKAVTRLARCGLGRLAARTRTPTARRRADGPTCGVHAAGGSASAASGARATEDGG